MNKNRNFTAQKKLAKRFSQSLSIHFSFVLDRKRRILRFAQFTLFFKFEKVSISL